MVVLVYIRSESLLISYIHSSHSSFVLGYISLLYSAPLLLVSAQLLWETILVRFLCYCPRDVAFTLWCFARGMPRLVIDIIGWYSNIKKKFVWVFSLVRFSQDISCVLVHLILLVILFMLLWLKNTGNTINILKFNMVSEIRASWKIFCTKRQALVRVSTASGRHLFPANKEGRSRFFGLSSSGRNFLEG